MTNPHIHNAYLPTRPRPPGDTLGDLLEERGIRQNELAARMDVTPKFVNELVAGKATITPTTALALENALDVPASFWLARDARYQEALARIRVRGEMEASGAWLRELPIHDMCRFGWIEPGKTEAETVEACLRYFGVASVNAWRRYCVGEATASAAYRASEKIQSNPGSLAAWLRRGEIDAAAVDCAQFDREKLLATLSEARKLTFEREPASFVPKLVSAFAACGLAIAIVRAPKGCPVNGAVRWLSPQKALVQLSFRYLRNDIFWFTFFHECGHIALHGKKMLFLENDEMSGDEEREADRFAADRLIPPHAWASFRDAPKTVSTISAFAESIGIAAGIVVGRLQHEKLIQPNRFNQLKVHYRWNDE